MGTDLTINLCSCLDVSFKMVAIVLLSAVAVIMFSDLKLGDKSPSRQETCPETTNNRKQQSLTDAVPQLLTTNFKATHEKSSSGPPLFRTAPLSVLLSLWLFFGPPSCCLILLFLLPHTFLLFFYMLMGGGSPDLPCLPLMGV